MAILSAHLYTRTRAEFSASIVVSSHISKYSTSGYSAYLISVPPILEINPVCVGARCIF